MVMLCEKATEIGREAERCAVLMSPGCSDSAQQVVS